MRALRHVVFASSVEYMIPKRVRMCLWINISFLQTEIFSPSLLSRVGKIIKNRFLTIPLFRSLVSFWIFELFLLILVGISNI